MSAGDLKSVKSGRVRLRPAVVAGVALIVALGAAGVMLLVSRLEPTEGGSTNPEPPSAIEVKQLQDRAEKGDAVAQNDLGELYLYGRGLGPDSKAAAGWFEKSAQRGNAAAQFNLGMLFDAGQGVPADYARAVDWYRKAAAQSHSGAQYSLAAMYSYGRGVVRDDREATRWLTLSAGQGYGLAQFSLGHRFIKGTGAPVDLVEAFKWLTLAEAAKVADASTALDEIKGGMSGAELTEARKRAREFVPKATTPPAPK